MIVWGDGRREGRGEPRLLLLMPAWWVSFFFPFPFPFPFYFSLFHLYIIAQRVNQNNAEVIEREVGESLYDSQSVTMRMDSALVPPRLAEIKIAEAFRGNRSAANTDKLLTISMIDWLRLSEQRRAWIYHILTLNLSRTEYCMESNTAVKISQW